MILYFAILAQLSSLDCYNFKVNQVTIQLSALLGKDNFHLHSYDSFGNVDGIFYSRVFFIILLVGFMDCFLYNKHYKDCLFYCS